MTTSKQFLPTIRITERNFTDQLVMSCLYCIFAIIPESLATFKTAKNRPVQTNLMNFNRTVRAAAST